MAASLSISSNAMILHPSQLAKIGKYFVSKNWRHLVFVMVENSCHNTELSERIIFMVKGSDSHIARC